jgi:protocatechuate 3,4-dioxygenase beta subunit
MGWYDDQPVGRLLSRREAVALLSASGLGAGVWRAYAGQSDAARPPQCVARPELMEGPYFVDKQALRSDIRADPATGVQKPGVPLGLAFSVSQLTAGRCEPLADASVDVWQCDALGEYSGFADPRFAQSTVGAAFLRGVQRTDPQGLAQFTTIYPGWYAGRAVHIHFKIRTQGAARQAYEFTSQLFMPEELNDQVHITQPYAKKGRRDTLNGEDGIYRQGGAQLLLQPAKASGGYQATFALALDLADARVGQPDGGGPGGRGPRSGGRGRGGA